MAKLPLPPTAERLAELTEPDDIVAVASFTTLARIYRAAGEHPVSWRQFREFGPLATARFDPHQTPNDGSSRVDRNAAVLYAATDLRTCVAEVFQTTRVLDRRSGLPQLAAWKPLRTLQLLDLTGTWPTRAGASQAISSGPRDRSRAWARAIRVAKPDLDGLWYRSSMDSGNPALCLWAPSRDSMPATPLANLSLAAPGLELPLGRAARALGYRLL